MNTRYFLTVIAGAFSAVALAVIFPGLVPVHAPVEEALGAPDTQVTFQKNLIPVTDSTYTLGTTTKTWLNLYTDEICLAGDCQTAWGAGGWTFSSTTIWGLFSNTATGLTYNSSTGATSLTAGYVIPLSASTTEWNTFYTTPSNRITAGTGLSWAGNTLNASAVGGDGVSNWLFDGTNLTPSTTPVGIVVNGTSTMATTTVSDLIVSTSIDLDTNGIIFDTDNDGALTITGASTGNDESLTYNFDDTVNRVLVTSTSGVEQILQTNIGTGYSYGVGAGGYSRGVRVEPYLEIGNTESGRIPYIGFNANLTASSTANLFSPSYSDGATRYSGVLSTYGASNADLTYRVLSYTSDGDYAFSDAGGYKDIFHLEDSTWNLGLYDTSPDARLEIAGTSTTPYFYISSDSTLNGDIFSVIKNGNVGIGTTSPSRKLTVGGDAWIGGNLTATGTVTSASASFTNATSTTSFFSALGTFTNAVVNTLATFLNATVTGLLDVGGGSLEIPNGASPTVDAIGEIAVDSTYGQFKYFDGGTTHVLTGTTTRSFSIASTTSGTGGSFNTATTTFLLANNPEQTTLIGWYCMATTTGSVSVRFGDGTNWTNSSSCSTGGATYATSNNTFTAFENFQVQIGTSASSPNRVTITTFTSKTAQ